MYQTLPQQAMAIDPSYWESLKRQAPQQAWSSGTQFPSAWTANPVGVSKEIQMALSKARAEEKRLLAARAALGA